jgi:hypothetical protein
MVLLRGVDERHECLEKKTSMLETGISSTLILCVNSIRFGKECSLPIRLFNGM